MGEACGWVVSVRRLGAGEDSGGPLHHKARSDVELGGMGVAAAGVAVDVSYSYHISYHISFCFSCNLVSCNISFSS